MLAVLVSMLSPSVGWATTFIKDVAVSCDTDEGTAKKALTNNGYTVVDTDLNAGCGKGTYYVYVGYTTTTNAAEAITDLIIAHNYSPSSDSFTWSYTGKFYRIATNVLENGNLNRGRGSGSANLWLYYSKTGNTTNGQSLVTSIYGKIGASSSSEYLVGVTSSTAKPEGSIDLNMGAGGSYVYLGQKKEHTHSFSYWNYTTDNHRYGCASCGYVKSTTAHNWSNSGAKFQDQTCTTAEVRYQTCTNCGRTNDANHTYIAGNALGHSFDEVNDPHHTNCTRCKHTFFRYQSKDGNVVKPYQNNFGEAQILSNTYTNGEGVIEFDRTLTTIGENAFFECKGLTGDLVIPNSVTSIGNSAFDNCSGLQGDLVIPNSVTSIGIYAFYKCSGFNGNLSIGNSVTSIGNSAFDNCKGLQGNLSIGNSVTSIGNSAFDNCSGLQGNLVIPNSVTSIGNYAFDNCKGLTGDLVIPNSVTSIGERAFYYCSGFNGNLSIGNSVTSIGNYAFDNCSGFNGNLSIGNSVISIGHYAFRECKGLTGDLVIPNSVTSIGERAFYNCYGFTGDLEIPNSVTSIGQQAFYSCSGFNGNLSIGNSVTSIGNYAFRNCTNLKNVLFLGDKPETMGVGVFYEDNLTLYVKDLSQWDTNEMYEAKSLTYKTWKEYCEEVIGEHDLDENCTCNFCGSKFHTFADEDTHHDFCTQCKHGFFRYQSKDGQVIKPYRNNFGDAQIESNTYANGEGVIEFDRKLTTIGENAFFDCSGFTGDLEIPNSVTSIGNSAFEYCTSFNGNLSIGNSVISIGNYAFRGCNGLTGDLEIPNSVTSIGISAFNWCSGFTGDLVIPNSVTSIGEYAFYYCSGFTGDLEIPNSVTSIGNYAFEGCTGLKNVLFLGDKPETMRTSVFYEDTLTLYVKDLSQWDTNEMYGAESLTYKTWKEYCEEVIGEHDLDENCTCSFCGSKIHTFADEDTHHDFCTQCKHGFFRYQSKEGQVIKPYSNNFGEAQIVSNTYAEGEGVIEFDRKLTTIGKNAFFDCSGFTGDLEIPNSVTSIGNNAFYYCSGFNGKLEIPNSVTSIGNYAFDNCSGFNGKLVIPNSVISIGHYAFRDCSGLTGDLVIPNSVISIGNGAFVNCSGLKKVLFLGDKPTMGAIAFLGDTLTLYVKDLSQWDTNEMYDAESLTYKTWKEYCEEVIGEHDLDENCTCNFCGSKFHTFADEDTHHDFCTQCKHGFFRYQSEEGQVIKPYLNNFGKAQIVSNTYAEGEGVIEFDRKLTTIGNYAFYECDGLTGDLVIPNSVTSIGNYAFYECTGLTGDLVIPNSVTTIGDYAFTSCYGFTGDLVIPNSVTTIGEGAFAGCKGFTGDLVIPNSVTSIENITFVGCESLTSVVIPNSVTTIGEGAFADCYSLQSVEIASLPLFGGDAFYDVPCGISIALTDESYVCGEKEFDDSDLPSLQSASYTRQMTNEWGTLVLPFGIDYLPENGNYRLYRLERVENQTLLLSEYAEGNIPAGTPVVVKAVGEKDSKGKYTLSIKQDAPTFDVKTKTVECDNNGWYMKGTLEPMTAAAGAQFNPAGMNVYYIAQNQFWYANQAFDMARFRAWFEAPDAIDASAMRFQIMEVEETGIHTCAAGEKAESSFDLQGRRMSAPVKGLQIINGRKVLKK